MSPQVRLRAKELKDAVNDYLWRRDTELAALDASVPLNIPFPEYLNAYAAELNHGSGKSQLLAIETPEGRHIGNCMYTQENCHRGEAETGIMIGDRDYWDRGYGTDAVRQLLDLIFTTTEVNRVYLRTLPNNHRAQRCFEKCGFSRRGSVLRGGYRLITMETDRQHWQTSL